MQARVKRKSPKSGGHARGSAVVVEERPMLVPPPADHPTAAYLVRFPLTSGETFRTFWLADAHLDSPECWRKLLFRHLDEAVACDAMIFDVGDILDIIGSRNDPRGNKGNVRPEDNTGHYLDSVVDNAARDLHPYRNHLAVIATGNHEAAVYKKLETDLTQRLVDKLNQGRDPRLAPIQRAGYRYWVVFQGQDVSRGARCSQRVVAYHGSGGGGEVSKGTMSAQRRMAIFGGADYVVQGHIHEKWDLEVMQEVLNPTTFEPTLRKQQTVQLGSYKVDWRLDGKATWHMMRAGGTPKPLGGKYINFHLRTSGARITSTVSSPDVDYSEMGEQ